MAKRSIDQSSQKLLKVWPLVEWLDKALYSSQAYELENNQAQELIRGDLFERLGPDKKILTHWLVYIMDAQTNARNLWLNAGPIMAEIVEQYSKRNGSALSLLAEYSSHTNHNDKKVPQFRARHQKWDLQSQEGKEEDKIIERAPGTFRMSFEIARTLTILKEFEKSLIAYLRRHQEFLDCADSKQIAPRIAFLFYLLTYFQSKRDPAPDWEKERESNFFNSEQVKNKVEERRDVVMEILRSESRLKEEFDEWKSRPHKRLWAATRDYFKQGSLFYPYFIEALNKGGLEFLANKISNDQDGILIGLEVPGDIWNQRFIKSVLGENTQSRELQKRFQYERDKDKNWKKAAVERFDISFTYASRMCGEYRQNSCIFRRDQYIWDYCPQRDGIEWKGRPCPVTSHLLGVRYFCAPDGCPVVDGTPENLCDGCKVDIKEIEENP